MNIHQLFFWDHKLGKSLRYEIRSVSFRCVSSLFLCVRNRATYADANAKNQHGTWCFMCHHRMKYFILLFEFHSSRYFTELLLPYKTKKDCVKENVYCINCRIIAMAIDLRCGSRIWSRGGALVLRPKVADVVKRSRVSKMSNFAAGVQGPLKGPGSFWVFNAQICILPHSRDSFSLIFDIYFNTKSW